MDGDIPVGFLDNTSLLTTPKSPKETSTSVKEKVRRKDVLDGKGSSALFNSMFSNIHEAPETSLPLADVTNLADNCEPRVLTYDESTINRSCVGDAVSPLNDNSSLGIISLHSSLASDIADSLLHENENYPEYKEQHKTSPSLFSKTVNFASGILESGDPSVSSALLGEPEKLQAIRESNRFHESALPDINLQLKVFQETLSKSEFSNHYGTNNISASGLQSKDCILTNPPNDSKISDIISESLRTEENEREDGKSKNRHTKEVPVSKDISGFPVFELGGETKKLCNLLMKTLLEPVKETSACEKTFTPNRTPGFVDTSSFQVDELYKKDKSKQSVQGKEIPDNLVREDSRIAESEIVFRDDQISGRSSSVGSSSENKSQFNSTDKSVGKSAEDLCVFSESEMLQLQSLCAVNDEMSAHQLFDSIDCDNISLGMSDISRHSSSRMSKMEIKSTEMDEAEKQMEVKEVPPEISGKDDTDKNVNAWVDAIHVHQGANCSKNLGTSDDKVCASNLNLHINLLKEGPPEMVADGEDWENKLGLLEHEEFYSPDAAVDMLKKHEELFEEENKLQLGANDSLMSQVSVWSYCQKSKISRPSWWSEVDDSKTASHVSFGQFIQAKTETLGSLSDDQNRERPHFGIVIGDSPPKSVVPVNMSTKSSGPEMLQSSYIPEKISCVGDTSHIKTPPINDDSVEQSSIISYSVISNVLDEASTDEPSVIASKFMKCLKKSLKPSYKKDRSILKGYVSSLKTMEECPNAEVQSVNNLCKSNSITGGPYKRNDTSNLAVVQSSTPRQNVGTMIKGVSECDIESKISQNYLKYLSSETNAGDNTKHSNSISSDSRSKSLSSLCSNPKCDSHLKNKVSTGNASGAQSMSLENVSLTTEDSGFSKTRTEGNICSHNVRTSDEQLKSFCGINCINCPSDLQYHHYSVCSDTSSKGHINVGGFHVAPVQSVFCAPVNCNTQFNSTQGHPMQTMQHAAINTMLSSSQNTQQLCSSISGMTVMKNANAIRAATMPLLPVCPGAPYGCLMPHSVQGPSAANSARVEVPCELTFPKETCVGDSQVGSLPLHNPLNDQLFCHVAITSAKINDTPVPPEISGFSIPRLVHVYAGHIADLKVEFTAKQAGRIVAILQITPSFSSLDHQVVPTSEATVSITVSCKAVNPSVTLRHNGTDRLDFDSVIGGSSLCRTITLTNTGKADVPVRLIISGDVNEKHSVRFALQDMSSMKHTSHANWHFLSPKVIFCRIFGCAEGSENKINIPVTLYAAEYENQHVGNNNPEVITGSITAVLDTPSASESLASIRTSATIGKVQLELKHHLKKPLVLKSKEGLKTSHHLTVVNKGNIPVTVDLAIMNSVDCFSVSPPTVLLPPFVEISIAITYTPISQIAIETKGLLQAAVHHSGQLYNLTEVTGHIISCESDYQDISLSSCSTQKTRPECVLPGSRFSSSVQFIESNKKYLAWGGIDIGKAVSKKFTIRNPSSDVLHATAFLKQKCFAFHIDDAGSLKQSIDITLKPKMEKILSIIFHPTDASPAVGKLALKPNSQNGDRTFSIPLSGYGGLSKIRILNTVQKEGFEHCLDVVSGDQCDRPMNKISLCNEGERPAYIKLVSLADKNFDHHLPNENIGIQPSEFILLEKERKDVLITFKSEVMNQFGYQSSGCGVIMLFYGDEIMRQKMRRLQGTSGFVTPPPAAMKGVNFDVTFLDEDKVPISTSYLDSPKDVELFYSSMGQLVIPLTQKIENQSFSRMTSFSALSMLEDSSLCISPNQTVVCRSTDVLPWTVYPSELTLSNEKWDGRLLLTSESEHNLKFKLSWSVNYICVSPVQGVLPAKGQIGLRVQIVPLCQAKVVETNRCFIKIHCEGSEKLIPVTVHGISNKEKLFPKSLKSNFLNSETSHNTSAGTLEQQSLCDGSQEKLEFPLKVPEIIELNRTSIGITSESTYKMENISDSTIRWTLVPLDEFPTMKSANKARKVPNVIQFVPSEGVLEHSQSVTITVKFTPFEAGLTEQQWEICMEPLHGKIYKTRVVVLGMACEEATSTFPEKTKWNVALSNKTSDVSHCDSKKTRQGVPSVGASKSYLLFSPTHLLKFPVTEVGKTCCLKVTLKNRSPEALKATVECPPPPFHVKHESVTIKGKYYLSVPVYFKPAKAMTSECLLIIHADGDNVIEVKLKGTSVPQAK